MDKDIQRSLEALKRRGKVEEEASSTRSMLITVGFFFVWVCLSRGGGSSNVDTRSKSSSGYSSYQKAYDTDSVYRSGIHKLINGGGDITEEEGERIFRAYVNSKDMLPYMQGSNTSYSRSWQPPATDANSVDDKVLMPWDDLRYQLTPEEIQEQKDWFVDFIAKGASEAEPETDGVNAVGGGFHVDESMSDEEIDRRFTEYLKKVQEERSQQVPASEGN